MRKFLFCTTSQAALDAVLPPVVIHWWVHPEDRLRAFARPIGMISNGEATRP